MKHLTVFFVLLLFLLGMNVAVGADFQKGADAYNKGDYATALKEWRPLAEQGQAGAENNLDVMYDRGKGVIQNDASAHVWWNIAASQGLEDAAKNRDIVSKKMPPSQIEKAQDLARECVKKNYKGC